MTQTIKKGIEVKNLSKSYHQHQVLKNISLTIASGETVGILGENGAGKTTLIECIEGIKSLDSGHILFDDMTANQALKKGLIGVQTQVASLPNEIKVNEVIDLVLMWNNRVEEASIIEAFDLAEVSQKQYHQLSIGWKRKLHLAIALLHQPEVIFLDEPTAGLDVYARQKFHKVIKELQKKGKTIIMTSHDMGEVQMLCHKVCFIQNGEVIFFGTVEAFLHQTSNHFKMIVQYQGTIEKDIYYIENINEEILNVVHKMLKQNKEILSFKIEESSLEEKMVSMLAGVR